MINQKHFFFHMEAEKIHLYLIMVFNGNDQLRISGCKCKKNIKLTVKANIIPYLEETALCKRGFPGDSTVNNPVMPEIQEKCV